MSFAAETKSALLSQSEGMKHDCCRKSLLYGILYGAGLFSRERVKLITSSEELAALTVKWLSERYQIEGNLYITEKKSGNEDERRSCKVTIPQKKELDRYFSSLGYQPGEPAAELVTQKFTCPNCRGVFVRGVFLSAGRISDPNKSYHLELSLPLAEAADRMADFLTGEGLSPKRMVRKTEQVLYYKDSEEIENFLAYIGATNAAFAIMNKKIERELRSSANRITNGEMANIGKTVAAAGEQVAAINALKESGELERLPEELKITARLRLEHPDASLASLAELHDPPITRSGVNHRLKKLLAFCGQ